MASSESEWSVKGDGETEELPRNEYAGVFQNVVLLEDLMA